MGKAETIKDVFMQFKEVVVTSDDTDSSVLVSEKVDTGLSIRGNLLWLIHLVECYVVSKITADNAWRVCLSTIDRLVNLPSLQDRGTLALFERYLRLLTTGGSFADNPMRQQFLPPIPIAAPQLVIYAKSDVDDANLRDIDVVIRLGFTTAPFTQAMYTEVAEVWGW